MLFFFSLCTTAIYCRLSTNVLFVSLPNALKSPKAALSEYMNVIKEGHLFQSSPPYRLDHRHQGLNPEHLPTTLILRVWEHLLKRQGFQGGGLPSRHRCLSALTHSSQQRFSEERRQRERRSLDTARYSARSSTVLTSVSRCR